MFAFKNKEKYLSDDMIHPNDEGVKLLGRKVADAIKSVGRFENSNQCTHGKTVEEERLLQ